MTTEANDKGLLFLVVDDQFNVRRMIANFLRTFGYNRVIDAPDGQKAWEKLQASNPGFVICDWNMPNLGGLGLLRRIRASEKHQDLPFLMVTAEVAEDIVAEAIEEGVDGYVLKPFQAKTLVERVETILERKRNPDPIDVHRIGSDPRSSYQQNGIMACNRTIDDVIIAAMTGSAWEDETGSTEVAFNAGGTALIAHGGVGLTKDKIITAKKQFMANMVDPTEKLYWAYGSEQFEDLMNIDEVVNNDYNQKALQDGRVVYFCGFNWIPTERLAVGAIAGTRRNVAWAKSGMGFQLGQGMEVQINKRADLSNIDQISISIDLGAARIEDGKVLAIDCAE